MRRVQNLAIAIAGTLAIGASQSDKRFTGPLSFFDGVTESRGTLKVMMRRPVTTKSFSQGELKPDGSLSLVQRVEEEGQPVHVRRWLIKQNSPGHFSGSMSDSTGPVRIDEEQGRYHFRFKMKGGLSVEQWLTPQAGGRSATTDTTVHKLGMVVARSHGVYRKLP